MNLSRLVAVAPEIGPISTSRYEDDERAVNNTDQNSHKVQVIEPSVNDTYDVFAKTTISSGK
jgi:hypothetical protein